jgi:uncharacterized protein involved in exopolysaccharide biosynthesis
MPTNQSPSRFRALTPFDDLLQPPLKDDRVSLNATISALWAHHRPILAATLLSGLIGYGLVQVVDKTYEARSTVFVTPPTFSTALTPQPFSIEAYERLAQSDYIQHRVTQELRQKKLLGEGEATGALTTQLYPSREPQKPFLPLVDLVAHSRTPELARAVANAWADVFLTEQTKMEVAGKASSVDFILQEFPKASARVLTGQRAVKLEETRLDREYARARSGAAVEWKKSRLESLEREIVRAEAGLLETQLDVKQGRESIARLEAELATAKPVLTLTKGPSDEALWNSATRSPETRAGAGDSPLGKLSIRTEETNPVYLALSRQLSEDRSTVGGLEARQKLLIQQLEAMRKDANALRADYMASEDRLVALEREHSIALAPHQLALGEAKARFDKLEEKIGDAQIAKAESDANVKIGAYAELPTAPVAPSMKKYIGASMLLGFVAAVLVVWLLSYAGVLRDSVRESPPPATPAVTS